jgi:hypothetical protein
MWAFAMQQRTISNAARVGVRFLKVALCLGQRCLNLEREEVASREVCAQLLALRRVRQVDDDRTRAAEPRRGIGVGAVVDDAESVGIATAVDLVVLPLEVAGCRWWSRGSLRLSLR